MIRKSQSPGDTRIVRRFAFFPVRTDDGYDIWLRWHWQEQRWGTRTVSMEGDFVWMWSTVAWFAHKPTTPIEGSGGRGEGSKE